MYKIISNPKTYFNQFANHKSNQIKEGSQASIYFLACLKGKTNFIKLLFKKKKKKLNEKHNLLA
jgi:uncharacterized protein YydD (DUF2326 family)